jgi:hypothetical protein
MSKKKKLSFSNWGDKVFDSELTIVSPVIIVPQKLNSIIRYVQNKIGNNEFSLLLRGRWTESGFQIAKEYYIPQQEVTHTSVYYKEDLSVLAVDWNTIYHSHPFTHGTPSFSEADKTTINCHFICSLLGTREGIKVANLSFFTGVCMVQVPAEVVIVDDEIEPIDISKITEKSYVHNWYLNWNRNFKKDDDLDVF